jgi:hypothetical protein
MRKYTMIKITLCALGQSLGPDAPDRAAIRRVAGRDPPGEPGLNLYLISMF